MRVYLDPDASHDKTKRITVPGTTTFEIYTRRGAPLPATPAEFMAESFAHATSILASPSVAQNGLMPLTCYTYDMRSLNVSSLNIVYSGDGVEK